MKKVLDMPEIWKGEIIEECDFCPFYDYGDGGWGAHCNFEEDILAERKEKFFQERKEEILAEVPYHKKEKIWNEFYERERGDDRIYKFCPLKDVVNE